MATEADVEGAKALENENSNRRAEDVRARDRARARDYYDRNQETIRAKKKERLAVLRAVKTGPGRPKAADRGGCGGVRVELDRPRPAPVAASGASQEQ